MSDMPNEVREAAREIARASLDALRNIIAEEFPDVEPEIRSEFVAEVCVMMSGKADDDQPITTDWLNVLFESEHDYVMSVTTFSVSKRHDLIVRVWATDDIRVCLYGHFQGHITTRGQLRLLLRALSSETNRE